MAMSFFQMITPKNYSFENSPREVLHNLAEFYKSRAEKSTQNNFVKEEIDDFFGKCYSQSKQHINNTRQSFFTIFKIRWS